jgi:putative oxidoreductase
MTTSATHHLSDIDAGPGKALNITLWCVQVLLALAFLGAGSQKLIGAPAMVELFKAIGVGQWFRYVTGLIEVSGAVLIVVPKTKSIGAAILSAVMLGAIVAHLFILHVPPYAPVVLLALSSFVLWGRRRELANFGRAFTS